MKNLQKVFLAGILLLAFMSPTLALNFKQFLDRVDSLVAITDGCVFALIDSGKILVKLNSETLETDAVKELDTPGILVKASGDNVLVLSRLNGTVAQITSFNSNLEVTGNIVDRLPNREEQRATRQSGISCVAPEIPAGLDIDPGPFTSEANLVSTACSIAESECRPSLFAYEEATGLGANCRVSKAVQSGPLRSSCTVNLCRRF